MSKFFVYLMTLNNGKRYVGMTKHYPRRIEEHSSSQWPIGAALRVHGLRSHELLGEFETREEAAAFEVEKIAELNTRLPHGYDVTPGGEGHSVKHPPEVCLNISEKLKKVYSDPCRRQNISDGRKRYMENGGLEAARASAANMRSYLDKAAHAEMLRSQASRAAHARWAKHREK